jgi:glutathione S-transferase
MSRPFSQSAHAGMPSKSIGRSLIAVRSGCGEGESMYKNSGKTHDRIILWGMPISAWSGKMRSYLTKKGVDFEERFPGDPRFQSDIQPAVGYFVVPVVEMPDGTIMQDSTDTMLHFEKSGIGRPMVPAEPRMAALAWMMNFFGSDLFLKPGMHYRWNFLSTHEEALRRGFIQNTPKHLEIEERFRLNAPFFDMAQGYTVQFGVTPESIPAIEQSLAEAFALLDEHFKHYPYLLGGRPSIADSGLMTMFYAHLARDLHPTALMQKTAMNVYNWTERMNHAHAIYGEYPDVEDTYFDFDALPESFTAFLNYIFRDCGTELKATVHLYNDYIETSPTLTSGSELEAFGTPRSAHPMFGHVRYELRGRPVVKLGMVDSIYQYQYVTNVIDRLDPKDRESFSGLLGTNGGDWMITLRARQPIKYSEYAYTIA